MRLPSSTRACGLRPTLPHSSLPHSRYVYQKESQFRLADFGKVTSVNSTNKITYCLSIGDLDHIKFCEERTYRARLPDQSKGSCTKVYLAVNTSGAVAISVRNLNSPEDQGCLAPPFWETWDTAHLTPQPSLTHPCCPAPPARPPVPPGCLSPKRRHGPSSKYGRHLSLPAVSWLRYYGVKIACLDKEVRKP
jgi:hypothetical protein